MSEDKEFEVIIVGGGPAGLNSAIMCASRRLRVLLLERDKLGGLLTTLYPNKTIPNYPGFPEGIVAIELVRNWLKHLRLSGVTVKKETVLDVGKDLTVATNKKQYRTKVVVLATGARPRHLGVLNEKKFKGRGVYYFPSHPDDFLGKKVLVVGGGDTAVDATLELLNLSDEITLVHRREGFRASDENLEKVRKSGLVDFVLKGGITALKGRHRVERAVIAQEGKKFEKRVDAVIIGIGLYPNNELGEKIGIAMDENGFIMIDSAQRTNIEGIFASGDIPHVGLRMITVAAAHGAIASHHIYSYVRKPYWAREAWPAKI